MPPRGPRSVLCVVVGHDMSVLERAGMHAAGDEAGEMRHVDHQEGADRIGDGAEALEIQYPRIGRAAGDDYFGLVLFRQGFDFVHVDTLILRRTP